MLKLCINNAYYPREIIKQVYNGLYITLYISFYRCLKKTLASPMVLIIFKKNKNKRVVFKKIKLVFTGINSPGRSRLKAAPYINKLFYFKGKVSYRI